MEKVSSTQSQHPPGALNGDLGGCFKTVREDIVDLAIDSIEPFPLIPDYRDPTESIYPIIIKSPDACRCVDGWNLVEDAQAAGYSSIRCHIFEIGRHSETEFAIRKVSARTKPHGGTCSYPETLRNTRLLVQIITEIKDDVVVYSHGGTRRGANFTSNREDDLRELLAERLGKSRTTINTYLNQSEYINETAFNALIEANVGRIFFDKCRVIKRDLIKNLKSDGLDETEVTEIISDKVIEWLNGFTRTGNVNIVQEDPDPGEPDETPENDSHGTPIEASEDEIFQHQSRANMHDSTEPPAEEDVQNEIRTVVSALTAYEEQTPMQTDVGLQVIDEQILKLSRIRQMLLDIMNGSESSAEEEAV